LPESKGETVIGAGCTPREKIGCHSIVTAFDSPSGNLPVRAASAPTTPLQALTTLNEKMFVGAAQAMALRV